MAKFAGGSTYNFDLSSSGQTNVFFIPEINSKKVKIDLDDTIEEIAFKIHRLEYDYYPKIIKNFFFSDSYTREFYS